LANGGFALGGNPTTPNLKRATVGRISRSPDRRVPGLALPQRELSLSDCAVQRAGGANGVESPTASGLERRPRGGRLIRSPL
jgi:hypothetical protein